MKIMRKPIQFICMAILLAGSVASCSCSSDNNKKSKPTTYVEAISLNDYTTAHKILDGLLDNVLYACTRGWGDAEDQLLEFWAAADHIYKAEMLYLIDLQDNAANQRLVNSLVMMNVIGDRPTGVIKDFYQQIRCKNYSLFVTRYNRLCDEILNVSILYKNSDMARQILSLYKEDCSFVGDKTYANGDMDWYFKVSNSSRDAATKKYNDAIKNGLLN
jgi:hypothetical protein